MKDRDISAGTAIATALWSVALILLLLRWIIDDPRIGATTVVVTGIAMTATIRGYFVAFTNTIRHAYNLDSPRDDSVTPLR